MLLGVSGGSEWSRNAFIAALVELFGFEVISLEMDSKKGQVVEILNKATSRWRDSIVINCVKNIDEYEEFSKRPFFLLANIQEEGMAVDVDNVRLQTQSSIIIVVKQQDRMDAERELRKIVSNRLSPIELNRMCRPDWDAYFMRIAEFASHRTNCMKRAVGAVLVLDKTIIATGYNGTARGTKNCMDGGCLRCNCVDIKCGQALDSCLCLHAEENAIIEAGRARARGATLYTTTSPCLSCAKKICQVGLGRVVYGVEYAMEHFSSQLLKDAGIVLEKAQMTWHKPLLLIAGADVDEQMKDLSL